jgi:hypothetical protein
VNLSAERQYRHPVALSALRPFVRLSRRLERQVVTPVPPQQPAPAAEAPTPAASAVPAVEEHRPAPVAPVAEEASPAAIDVDAESTSLATEQFQSVDASVVPVPIESLNRLVLAVDELGSEMTHVRQAIRDLTAALSESQANFARLLSSAQAGASPSDAPDPLAAVTGPYVSGAPTPTPFATTQQPVTVPPAAPAAAPEPPTVPMPTAAPVGVPMPEHINGLAAEYANSRATPEHANGLGDLPIVSTGAVQVVIGPITSLEELDDAVEHIRRINGVESVSVTSFEGPHVVLTADLSRALPLASLLRNELGREVASCRLVDGRIVVDFGEAGPRA